MNTLQEQLKNFFYIDNDIKERDREIQSLDKPLKVLKQKRQVLIDNITNIIESNQIYKYDFRIGNNRCKYETIEKKDSGLTQKFVKEGLDSYFKRKYPNKLSQAQCEEKSAEILQFILNRRKVRKISTLKRI